jgi:hypothetical protein
VSTVLRRLYSIECERYIDELTVPPVGEMGTHSVIILICSAIEAQYKCAGLASAGTAGGLIPSHSEDE